MIFITSGSDVNILLTMAALRDNNPVLYIEEKMLYGTSGPVPEDDYLVSLGQANIKRAGADVTLITYAGMLSHCLQAAEILAGGGIDLVFNSATATVFWIQDELQLQL